MTSAHLPSGDPEQLGEVVHIGLPPANDRILTTCFLAALFHGIVILGVTFSAPKNGGDAPALEILLVNDQAPSVESNADAQYIAQRTQLGSGNWPRSGVEGSDGPATQESVQQFGDEEMVVAHAPSAMVSYPAAAPLAMASNVDGTELRLRGKAKNPRWVAADTRRSDVAVYLDGWRRKIERVGTMNFPNAARHENLSGTPVIEVTIGANGKLLKTHVRRSSGHVEIDEAAMRILKLASPYDPFPRDLGAKHDQIRIAYEWQFLGGSPQGGNL